MTSPRSREREAAAATYDFQIVQSEFSKFFTVEAPEGRMVQSRETYGRFPT